MPFLASKLLAAVEKLFDKEPCGRVKYVAVGALSDHQHLSRTAQPELGGKKAQIVLILADAVGEDLEGKEDLGRGGKAAQPGQIEDRGSATVAAAS